MNFRDFTHELESDPELRKIIHPEDPNKCPACNGTGERSWGKLGIRGCVKCKGTGKVRS